MRFVLRKERLGVGSNIFSSLADAMSGPTRSRVPVTSTATAARRGAGDSGAGGGVAAAPVASTAAALGSQDARASVPAAAPRAAAAEPPVKAAAHLVAQDELEALVQEARLGESTLTAVCIPAQMHAHARLTLALDTPAPFFRRYTASWARACSSRIS